VLPPTAGLISKLYGAQRLATLLGITFVVHQVGAFLGSWLGGLVLQSTGSYDRMWIFDLVLATGAIATSLIIREQRSVPGGSASSMAPGAAAVPAR
jgi:predicted MFS family arabinose efflux permease